MQGKANMHHDGVPYRRMGGFTSSLPAWFELTRSLLVVNSGLTDVGNRKRLQCT
jgi:hypothetical protein